MTAPTIADRSRVADGHLPAEDLQSAGRTALPRHAGITRDALDALGNINRRINGKDLEDRFLAMVRQESDCWLWTGAVADGYGRFWNGARKVQAHRWAYEQFVGPIPDGLVLDHLCRVRHCVRPEHLEPVTFRENILRGTGPTAVNAARSHCTHGHELTGRNLVIRSDGRRGCRTCNAQRARAYYAQTTNTEPRRVQASKQYAPGSRHQGE